MSVTSAFPGPLNRLRTAKAEYELVERLLDESLVSVSNLHIVDELTGMTHLQIQVDAAIAIFYAMCRSSNEIAAKEAKKMGLRGAQKDYDYFMLISPHVDAELGAVGQKRHDALHQGVAPGGTTVDKLMRALGAADSMEQSLRWQHERNALLDPLRAALAATEVVVTLFYSDIECGRTTGPDTPEWSAAQLSANLSALAALLTAQGIKMDPLEWALNLATGSLAQEAAPSR